MFREMFYKWLYADMKVDDFEVEWEEAFEEFGLHEKCWANQMYEKRHMWCNAYLRGKFCTGYRTTSREAIPDMMKLQRARFDIRTHDRTATWQT
ncbi:hypothetical protein Ahy_B10g105932 [Arachis hypogaea]|uniref:Protein FAR1-RELATED SEQUENCE n=1 Tax=Arachis hypogaea TaxID=3818 RepID=A0A444X985_ARAHY|nr:hypothetical protein Ahy_B10g105932 [Arachis hypogaea]